MDLEDRLYSSTEVAEILGVSLRSVYRYLDDGDLKADIKTATGRHRFTKKNILDFLYPQKEYSHKASVDTSRKIDATEGKTVASQGSAVAKDEAKEEVISPAVKAQQVAEPAGVTAVPVVSAAPVGVDASTEGKNAVSSIDWLARFRAAQEARLKDTKTNSVQPVAPTVASSPLSSKPLIDPLLGDVADDTLGSQATSVSDQGTVGAAGAPFTGGLAQPDYDDTSTLPNDKPLPEVPPTKPSQIDWLAKFKAAREQLYKNQQSMPASSLAQTTPTSVDMETKTAGYQSSPASAPVAPAAPIPPVLETPVIPVASVPPIVKVTSVTDSPSETKQPAQASQPSPVPQPVPVAEAVSQVQVPTQPVSDTGAFYYTSGLQGLKELAHTLHKSAATSLIPYAFTMYAGMSLYKSIKPFSVLHVYIKPDHRTFFEKVLRLTPSDKNTAQLCLIASEDNVIFDTLKEMHGLKVVSTVRLKKDLYDVGEDKLAAELDLLQ